MWGSADGWVHGVWGCPWKRGQHHCGGLGTVSLEWDRGKDGVQVPGSLCGWSVLSSELEGAVCQASWPHGNPSTAGPSGEAALHQPKLRGARCTKQGRTALGESSVPAAQEGSAAGGQLRGLRLELLSSHLSTLEQPSRVVP